MSSISASVNRWVRNKARIRLGVARRSAVARREGRASVVAPTVRAAMLEALVRPAPRRHPRLSVRFFRFLATLTFAVGDVHRSTKWLCRGLRADPDAPPLLALTARVAEIGGPAEPVLDQHCGLITCPGLDRDLLAAVLQRAEVRINDPRCMRIVAEYGRRAGMDSIAAAERLVRLSPRDQHSWYLLGRTRIEDAYDRGAQTNEEVAAIQAAFRFGLEIAPADARMSFHLVRSYVSTGEWASALESSFQGGGKVRRSDVLNALDAAPAELVQRFPGLVPDSWYAIHAEALGAGRVRHAATAKDAMALCSIERTDPYRTAGLGPSLNAARALAHLGRLDESEDRLRSLMKEVMPSRDALAVARLVDDLAFRRGDLTVPRWAEGQAVVTDSADRRFRSLIEGRSVAVVGPSVSDAEAGSQIDGHDVVIRTKFVPGRVEAEARTQGRRTDIAYYTDSSARIFGTEIRSALMSGDLQMAVLRPSAFRAAPWPPCDGRLRYVPAEDTLPFQGTHFAIQRILYDLLHYSPSQITLFNIDFFTGLSTYLPGYATEVGDVFKPNRFRPIRSTAMHDLREDFVFTKLLSHRGLIATSPPVAAILALDTESYLEEVELDQPTSDETRDIVR